MCELTAEQKAAGLASELRDLQAAVSSKKWRAPDLRHGVEAVEAVIIHASDRSVRERAIGALAAYAMDSQGSLAYWAKAALARQGISTIEL